MKSPDEYEYILWEVLKNIDFSYKSTGRLDNLNYLFFQNDYNYIQYQLVFQRLETQGFISKQESIEASIFGNNKNIEIIIPYSIKNIKKINKLLLELSEKYKNDTRRSKPILHINEKGIYLDTKPQQKYVATKKRWRVIKLLMTGSKRRKTLLEEIDKNKDKDVNDIVTGINKVFIKKVSNSPSVKLIILSGSRFYLNSEDYDIRS